MTCIKPRGQIKFCLVSEESVTASWLIDTAKMIEVYYARAPFILGRGKEWVKCNIQ